MTFKLNLIILFIISACFSAAGFGQYRQLRLANEELSKNNFNRKVVLEKIKKYEKENGITAESKYVRSIYLKKISKERTTLDTAYIFFTEAYMDLEIFDPKVKENLCEDVQFCLTKKSEEEAELELLLFKEYTRDNNIAIAEEFIEKYPLSNYYGKVKNFRDSLEIEQIKPLNDEYAFKEFLKKRPYSVFYKIAESHMYTIAFEKTKLSKSVDKYNEYIKSYPNSPYFNEAIEYLSARKWEEIGLSNNRKMYVDFISEFPTSSLSAEAKQKVENIDWADALKADDLVAFEAFAATYKNSRRLDEANLKIKELKELVLPYLTKNRKYALINTETLKFISQTEYDKILVLDKNRFAVRRYGKYGIVDNTGQVAVPTIYDCLEKVGDFLIMRLGNQYGVIDKENTTIIDFSFDHIEQTPNDFFKVHKTTGSKTLYGLISGTGETILEPIYSHIQYINENTFYVDLKGQSYLIDKSGAIKSQKYSKINTINYSNQDHSFLSFSVKNKIGVINSEGVVVLPAIYDGVKLEGNYLIVKKAAGKTGQLEGITDLSGNILVEPKYKEILFCKNNFFSVNNQALGSKESSYRLFDVTSLRFLTDDSYDNITSITDDLFEVSKNGKLGYVSSNGEVIVDVVYDFYAYGEGGDGMEGDGMEGEGIEGVYWGGEDNAGNCYITRFETLEYAEENPEKRELFPLTQDGTVGYMNKKGEIIIPFVFNYGSDFNFGLATVTNSNNQYSIINTKGEVILENANILSFIDGGKYAIANQNNSYFKINVATLKAVSYTLLPGMDGITHYKRYKTIQYKGESIYVTNKDQILMAKDVDFSDYEFRKSVEEARSAYYQGQYDQAISQLQALYNKNANYYDIPLLIGMCYVEQNDSYSAKRYFDIAIEIDPSNSAALYQRYYLNKKQSNWYEIKNDLTAILNLEGGYNEYLTFELGYAYQQSGYNDDAFKCYSRILKNNPKHATAYNNRGVIYSNKGEYELALNDYLSALKSSKNESDESKGLYLSNVGDTFIRLNRKAEACAYYSKGAELGNSNCTYNFRARCKAGK